MKKLFAIVAVIGVFTFGSIQLAQAQDAPAAEQTNNKLLLPPSSSCYELLLLLQKRVVFTRKSKLNSSKVLHLS